MTKKTILQNLADIALSIETINPAVLSGFIVYQ
jgi:hypothetical protein